MRMQGIKLWLDDERDPQEYGLTGWTWVKTADRAIWHLESGYVIQASLDHDLGDKSIPEKTGYTVVCWMEEFGVWPCDGVSVHSMNPVGRAKMLEVIRANWKPR